MAIADRFVLNAAVVEVQYQKGMVFFDRCGGLMERLSETLGPAFDPSILQMVHGELVNATERLLVRYGASNLNVTQNWVRTPVRVEMVAPLAWELVAEVLGVGRHVSRFGVRFVCMWEVEDPAEAELRIAGAQLFSESSDWVEAFGPLKTRAWSVTSESEQGTVRAALSGMETKIEGAPLAADLLGVVPKYSVVLDLDYASPGDAPYTMKKGQMKDFIRTSWERAKKTAAFVHGRL